MPLLLDAARATDDPAQALDLLVSSARAGVEAGIPAVIAEAAELAEAIRPNDEKSSFMRDLLVGQGAMWAGDTDAVPAYSVTQSAGPSAPTNLAISPGAAAELYSWDSTTAPPTCWIAARRSRASAER